MTFQENFYAALERFLNIEGAKVTGFDEVTRYGGGCETCAYTYVEVTIFYEVDGERKFYDYNGTFSDLINALV